MRPVLVLRPQPGADRTAARAREIGLDPVVAPLFKIESIGWLAPDPARFDALMLTSANAARLAGPQLRPLLDLPCYAVGDTTAAAARDAGLVTVRTGPNDVAGLVAMMAEAGVASVFHPCGVHHGQVETDRFEIVSQPVYESVAAKALPAAAEAALGCDALVLLHSPRAATLFADLVGAPRAGIELAAISAATAAAAGSGWRAIHVAERPRDEALLELARRLCQNCGQ